MTRRIMVTTEEIQGTRWIKWQAKLDGYRPHDEPVGYGPTEADAVSDLYIQIALCEERAAALAGYDEEQSS
jgi:hypothetical protein